MAQQCLNGVQWHSAHCEVRSERMTQNVPRDPAQSGLFAYHLYSAVRARAVEPLSAVQEDVAGAALPLIKHLVHICVERKMPLSIAFRCIECLPYIAE